MARALHALLDNVDKARHGQVISIDEGYAQRDAVLDLLRKVKDVSNRNWRATGYRLGC